MSFGHLNHGKPPLEVTVVTSAGADIVQLTAGGAITAGDVLMIQADGSVVQSTTALSSKAIGVALEAITADEATAGASVRVCVAGGIQGVNGAANLNDGDPLLASTTVAGQVDGWGGASNRPPVAVAQSATGGVAAPVTVYWFRKL
jgi:hypothetical protein